MAQCFMNMFGLPTETIVIVGGAVLFFTVLLVFWGLYYRGEE